LPDTTRHLWDGAITAMTSPAPGQVAFLINRANLVRIAYTP
jgi:hypothetical protein